MARWILALLLQILAFLSQVEATVADASGMLMRSELRLFEERETLQLTDREDNVGFLETGVDNQHVMVGEVKEKMRLDAQMNNLESFQRQAHKQKVETHSSALDFQHPPWASSCKSIYLDVGSNIGVQVRKLYEAEKYPAAKTLPIFTEHFGPPTNRQLPGNQSGVCALGLEPNPDHAARLQRIEKAYTARGWHVHFYPYAAWKAEGTMGFWVDPNTNRTNSEWNSMLGLSDHGNTYQVRTVDLSDFVASLPSGAVKFMKMDIEGSEYETLANMIEKRTLCANIIPESSIEVHPWGRTELWKGEKSFKAITEAVEKIACSPGNTVTSFTQLDDEAYFQDVDDLFGEPSPPGWDPNFVTDS